MGVRYPLSLIILSDFRKSYKVVICETGKKKFRFYNFPT